VRLSCGTRVARRKVGLAARVGVSAVYLGRAVAEEMGQRRNSAQGARRSSPFFLVFSSLFPNLVKFKCGFKFQIYLECTVQKLHHENILYIYLFYFSSFIHDSNHEIENSSHHMNFREL
jgi:hypothetical protein